MIKKMVTTVLVLITLTLCVGGLVAHGEETPPQIYVKLNSDGSTVTKINISLPKDEGAQIFEFYKATFEEDGYTVDYDEDEGVMILNKEFPKEKGYLIDLSVFGVGEMEFVEFKGFFMNRYGIKTTTFNREDMEPGTVFFSLHIETPVKATLSTADEIIGSGNFWKVETGRKNDIALNFKVINTIPFVSTIFAALILIALIFFIFFNKKRDAAKIAEYSDLTPFEDSPELPRDFTFESGEHGEIQMEEAEDDVEAAENTEASKEVEFAKNEEPSNGDETEKNQGEPL